jgi:RimM protein, required for 16S rRNA processing
MPRGRYGTPSWKDEMVLIPLVPSIVPTIDIERGVIYIDPPGGLLDLTYVKEGNVRIKGFLPAVSSFQENRYK